MSQITDKLIAQLTELGNAQKDPEVRRWIAEHVANDISKRKEARGRKRGRVRAVEVRLKSNPRVKMFVPKDALEEVEIERMG